MKRISTTIFALISLTTLVRSESSQFPGVTDQLASFCASRPSLPIDLASMIVHVKKETSFNYKLYLFSADHVIQTGQIVPRGDFRIHSFPVKVKPISEFWTSSVSTYQHKSHDNNSLQSVDSSTFNLKHFLRQVPLNGIELSHQNISRRRKEATKDSIPEDLRHETLPGDSQNPNPATQNLTGAADLNKQIHFDRDDQISSISRRVTNLSHDYLDPVDQLTTSTESRDSLASDQNRVSSGVSSIDEQTQQLIPVGSFSSFNVNLTYLVRKDFDQKEPEIVKILVDPQEFKVVRLEIISDGSKNSSMYPQSDDYNFLKHKLLRDPNTRITAINQIYENWITRNFYTVVYIQRRLNTESQGDEWDSTSEPSKLEIVNDKLTFRGTSIALLGADQIDYSVKAAAFITEKNGLHYYLEFLASNKFYLCAVDWSRRPFKTIDSRRFPIKATKTKLDNEELLLCPPAVCYSDQPSDEIIPYGRILLDELEQKKITALTARVTPKVTKHSLTSSPDVLPNFEGDAREVDGDDMLLSGHYIEQPKAHQLTRGISRRDINLSSEHLTQIQSILEAVQLGSSQIETRLHLRDWHWTLKHKPNTQDLPVDNKYQWRYENARRNEIKAKPDTYGYGLTGHEVDAAYRIYNELYLISSDHLITINYTLANETVTSSGPIGDEFFGLSSTLIDPISGAFYDRYSNQLYFFKGDRYVGYDYGTKEPLEEFQLEPRRISRDPTISMETNSKPLVSSLPVVGIIGRQLQVDGVYHDQSTDLVYIFTGMKFFTFRASEFKDGAFKSRGHLPKMFCINEHFLDGCLFDKAYPNPCRDEKDTIDQDRPSAKQTDPRAPVSSTSMNETNGQLVANELMNFTEEQQLKLRSIAAKGGILDILLLNDSLRGRGSKMLEPIFGDSSINSKPQEQVIIYLLIAMVAITAIITMAMIMVLINWDKIRRHPRVQIVDPYLEPYQVRFTQANNHRTSHYLANQHDYHSRRNTRQNQQIYSRPYDLNNIRTRHPDDSKNIKTVDSMDVDVTKFRRYGTDSDVDIDNSSM